MNLEKKAQSVGRKKFLYFFQLILFKSWRAILFIRNFLEQAAAT